MLAALLYITCLVKKYTGIECPGCGVQRSFDALLHGDLLLSIKLYPALLPSVFMFAFLGVHLIAKFKNGGQWLLYMFIANAAIVVINYVSKFI